MLSLGTFGYARETTVETLRPITDDDVDVIKRILNQPDFQSRGMKALTTMQHQLFGWGNPVDQQGCISWFAYHYATAALAVEWAPWKFRYEPFGGQLRVVSKNLFGHRVSFIVSRGHGDSNAVKFKAEKGIVTRGAALENRAFGQKVRPTLFDFDPTLTQFNPSDNLNFGVVYDFTKENLLEAWMFFGVEFVDGTRDVLECLEVVPLGRSPFNPENIPDIGPVRNYDPSVDYGLGDELLEREDDQGENQATGT